MGALSIYVCLRVRDRRYRPLYLFSITDTAAGCVGFLPLYESLCPSIRIRHPSRKHAPMAAAGHQPRTAQVLYHQREGHFFENDAS